MTTRLRLKRTPAEKEERARRRARRAAKRKRSAVDEEGTSTKRHHDDEMYGPPPPPSSSHKPDYDAIRAELEEMQFREKMWEALGDDERLDGIDARFNSYAHIPDRWRDARESVDPQYMDDDEYAEWIRQGMWKRTHAREYEEQAKRDADRAAKKAREKELKAETARIARLAREQEERRRSGRQRQREEDHRQQYERRWETLLDARINQPLSFDDIPWPLFSTKLTLLVEDITPEAIASFLLPDANEGASRRNRDKLKETLLRFHPDKFEGRLMCRVLASDSERVREAVGQVARALNVLMSRQP